MAGQRRAVRGPAHAVGPAAPPPGAEPFYKNPSDLVDVTSNVDNAQISCSTQSICNAVPGYDGPTGNGTPDGIAAF